MSSAETIQPYIVANISTPRLELVAITPESLRSEQAADGRLQDILHCTVTSEWPHADWEPHVFELLLQRFADDPGDIGWHRYIMLCSGSDGVPVLIGSAGGMRWPHSPRAAEIGYAIIPEFRLQGYALEATQAMIAWIEATGTVDSLCAHTYPELLGSIRILERCGFTLEATEDDNRTLRYRRGSMR